MYILYFLAASYSSDCEEFAAKTTQYNDAPDTCPADDYSCVNKADALVEMNDAQTACNAQKQSCNYSRYHKMTKKLSQIFVHNKN